MLFLLREELDEAIGKGGGDGVRSMGGDGERLLRGEEKSYSTYGNTTDSTVYMWQRKTRGSCLHPFLPSMLDMLEIIREDLHTVFL